MAQNRTSLRATIRHLLGETTPLFWTDVLINQWIEDGQLDVAYRAKCKRKTGYVTTVASTMEYALSTHITDIIDIVGPVRIYDGTNSKWMTKMDPVTQDYMDINYEGWESSSTTGEPTMYWYDTEINKIWVFQPPSSQFAGTNYLKIPYAAKPTVIASDAGYPDIPEPLFQAIISFVVARGMESRGYQDIADGHWNTYYNLVTSYGAIGKTKEDQEIIMRPA